MTKPTVHIIGSGISGLRCAENLLQCGIEVKIVEMTDSIGGRMRTTEKMGFFGPRVSCDANRVSSQQGGDRLSMN